MDSKQSSKRTELKECEKELTARKKRVGEAEGDLNELTQKETTFAKKSTDLLVSIDSTTMEFYFHAPTSQILYLLPLLSTDSS